MKEKIIVMTFVGILFIFPICGLIIKDKEISSYERRRLANTSSLKEDFVDNLDDYLSDQFPLRNEFISTNSIFDRYVLGNVDSNDVYIMNGYVIDKNYPLKEKDVKGFIDKINYINDTYLKNNNVFYTIIPDKGYFLDDTYLKLDYDKMFRLINDGVKLPYIDIKSDIRLDDYYKTDIHIRQEAYSKIIEKIVGEFGFLHQNDNYLQETFDDFYGASYSKVPLFVKPDKLTILHNDVLDGIKVTHLEYGKKDIYDMEKLNSSDLYNVYLSGPSALIEIENSLSSTDRELVIFRDSFASSFAPLLAPYYKKITLIDLRYIRMDLTSNYVDFNDKDVLFSYSTLIVNDSNILKVNMK